MNRNKLYSTMLIACLVGYSWFYLAITNNSAENKPVEVCLIKHTTNMPCPSCGSTRSVISLSKGNFIQALKINPLGYIVALIMLLTPLWITVDMTTKRKTFFEVYQKIEAYSKRPKYAVPLILLVIINWIWNITKGL